MKRANEYRAYFSMSGDFNPDEITAGIGLTPTRTLMKGSVHEKTRHIQKFSIWSLNSRLDQFASLEDRGRTGATKVESRYGSRFGEDLGRVHAASWEILC